MDAGAVAERAAHIEAVCGAPNDSTALRAALIAVREVQAWIEARRATLVTHLTGLESFPEQAIAETSKCSLGEAAKQRERADTLDQIPQLAAALDDGAVTTGHVDAVTRGRTRLESSQHAEFFDRVDDLAGVAATGTIGQFTRRVDLEIRRLQAVAGEDAAERRLARQRRDTRLSTWTDSDGMWCLRGRFDPVTGIPLATAIDTAVQTLFAEAVPEHCPTDPVEKQRFLAAHALARLAAGNGGAARSGRPEFLVVIDADAAPEAARGTPTVEWPIPVEVPGRVLAQLAGDAEVVAVVVRNGVVLHAPGQLDLGRTTRLANRAQRRALRGLYRTCAIPGCDVGYDHCKLHHIIWWRHGGRTDLDNLLPVCSHHHGKIHHDDWVVEIGTNRELTLRLPDGQIHNTGPPTRHAA